MNSYQQKDNSIKIPSFIPPPSPVEKNPNYPNRSNKKYSILCCTLKQPVLCDVDFLLYIIDTSTERPYKTHDR